MKVRLTTALLAALAVAGLLAMQAAASDGGSQRAGVVFVQTNEPTGNHVVVFDRETNGELVRVGVYETGGKGGVATPGTQSDHLGSQGSLAYDASQHALIAVNAGSDTVTTFAVIGDRLERRSVVSSGGDFPASIAVRDQLVYVLNSGGQGIVQGFRLTAAGLTPISGSARSLGLANTSPPFFLTSPGEVGFTPDGQHLIATTKGSGSTIDVFAVAPDGRLSLAAVKNPSATPVPFAFTFAPSGLLVSGEAGTSSVTTYHVQSSGTLTDPRSLSDNQVALCWIQRVGRFYYVSNTGSNTLSGYTIDDNGQPALVTADGIVATTDPGPIDLTSPTGTSFLYGETGGGTVGEYRVNASGTLTKLGTITGLPVGIEGIAST